MRETGEKSEKSENILKAGRIPFRECTNENLPKTLYRSNKVCTSKSPRKTAPKRKHKDANRRNNRASENRQKGEILSKNTERYLQIHLDRFIPNNKEHLQNKTNQDTTKEVYGIKNVISNTDHSCLGEANMAKQSIPLVNRLRNYCKQPNYFESSLEESTIQNETNMNNLFQPKLPIYKQVLPIEPKTNSQDPYALDIVDSVKKPKKKRKKRKIPTKGVEKKGTQGAPTIYEENINKVLERVRTKMKSKKLNKNITNNNKTNSKTDNLKINNKEIVNKGTVKEVCQKVHFSVNSPDDSLNQHCMPSTSIVSDEESRHKIGKETNFENTNMSLPQISNLTNDQLNIPSTSHILVNSENISIEKNPDTPKTRKLNSTFGINVVSDITLRNGSNHNYTLSKTSIHGDLLEKSHNLQREFNGSSLFNMNSSLFEDTVQNIDENINYESDIYLEESEEEDEYFGFRESSDTLTEINLEKKKEVLKQALPWRFSGFFKRNPYFLRIKKNGLPCMKQDMVIDYEFVKRIEAFSSNNINKNPESPRSNPLVQTSMLDYIQADQENPNNPSRPSLFDYEEFTVAKPPRKALKILQDQFISTPKKDVHAVIESPNVSCIPRNEENENRMPRSYRKKSIKENRKEGLEILPSVLEKDHEEVNDVDVHLFEDFEMGTNHDLSIKLPTIKYRNRGQRRRRHISEGSDDGEKQHKKKKKDMMTEKEEADFEDWVSKTNARFEEEDKFELTIE